MFGLPSVLGLACNDNIITLTIMFERHLVLVLASKDNIIKPLHPHYTCGAIIHVACQWCPLKNFMGGGAVNFLNLPMVSGFTWKIYT